MKNQWIHLFSGYVKLELKGVGAERFLNRCLRQNIYIWNVRRQGSAVLTCYVSVEDIGGVEELISQDDCELRVLDRHGLPFLYKRMLKNGGIIAGILAFLLIMTLLSNMVWNIDIQGAQPKTEHELEKALKEMGVSKGKLQFLLPSPQEIQQKVTEELENVTWVGVKLNGTTYHFQVVEKELPEKPKATSPRHLVAKKKAIIHEMFVEQGQQLVDVNDYVKKGQILVSGIIGEEDKTKVLSAKGKIFGETWYKSSVSIPLKTNFSVLTGNEYKKYSMEFFGVNIPVWGFKDPGYSASEVNVNEHQIHFLKWSLPVTFNSITIQEKEDVVREYSKDEAVEAGLETAKEELMQKLEEEAIIKDEKVLHQTNKNGKVKLIIHFTVIEEISVEQSIIQGD